MIANMFTFGNLLCGVFSILIGAHPAAPWLIGLGMVLDSFDGRVARLTGSTGEMGKELDALADIVTFGVAPAVLVYRRFMPLMPGESWQVLLAIATGMFCVAGAYRLARFNITPSSGDHFVGLPITWAGGSAAGASIMNFSEPVAPVIAMLLLGYLMVSRVPYPNLKHVSLRGWIGFVGALVAVIAVAALQGTASARDIVATLILMGGLALGPAGMLLRALTGTQRSGDYTRAGGGTSRGL